VTQGVPINNKVNMLPNNNNATIPANGTTVGKVITLPTPTNGTAPANNTTGGKVVTLPAQTVNKTVVTDTLKSNGPTNKIVDTPVANKEFKTELKADQRDDRVIKFNNNAGQGNKQGGIRLQNNFAPSKPRGGGTSFNNWTARFAQSNGGGGGRRGF
jgi:hypothetical protein